MRRSIIFLHRYIGIPMSLVFVVWFLSGIVMMYTGDMPTLSESARLKGPGPGRARRHRAVAGGRE
jgi:hypothetical protein